MPSREYHSSITLSRLPPEVTTRGHYVFQFYVSDDPDTRYECHIPGARFTRDGPTAPQHPEQEAWMRKHSGLKEVWYVTYETRHASEMDAFIARLTELRDAGY